MNFRVWKFSEVRRLHYTGEVGKWNYLSMTYSLSNKCTKNYCTQTILVQVIVEDVVARMFWDTVCECVRWVDNDFKRQHYWTVTVSKLTNKINRQKYIGNTNWSDIVTQKIICVPKENMQVIWYSHFVCLPVCVSVAAVICVKLAEHNYHGSF